MRLIDKYRPKRMDGVIGQERATGSLRRLIGRRGFDRAGILIEGPTGTGKTSIAWALAGELGAKSWAITELDGDQCNAEAVRRISESIGLTTWATDAPWRIWIVNEAHAMTSRAVQAWLTLLDRLPAHWVIVFTTTQETEDLFGEFSSPFADRCICYRLTKIGLSEKFARLAHRIAKAEGLNGRPLSAYRALVKDCHNSMRAVLQHIERGDMAEPPDHSPAIKKMIRGGQRARRRRQRKKGDTKGKTKGDTKGKTKGDTKGKTKGRTKAKTKGR